MADHPATTSAAQPERPAQRLAEPPTTSALDRRTMLKGLAVAGAAVPILAACGSSTGDGASKTPSGGGSPTSSSGGNTTGSGGGGGGVSDVLAKASDVPVGGGVILPDKTQVITQPKAGTFEGFSSTCTHMGCTVTTISGGTINCPCHGSKYSITDGSVQAGPAPAPLPKKPVKDAGGDIVPA
jgi:nitrite reductase/ring-hydroxylating ferredoxin subunit